MIFERGVCGLFPSLLTSPISKLTCVLDKQLGPEVSVHFHPLCPHRPGTCRAAPQGHHNGHGKPTEMEEKCLSTLHGQSDIVASSKISVVVVLHRSLLLYLLSNDLKNKTLNSTL